MEAWMAKYSSADIRNVVLLGHAGAGKTSLAETMLHKTGVTNRLGSVDEKSSILDCDEEERQRGHSIDSALAHINYKGKEINLIDTPGYPDFLGASLAALPGAETAVIVISAQAGIQTNTRKLFHSAKERGMACIIVINKIDSGTDEIAELVKTIQESFGRECVYANLAKKDGHGICDCILAASGDGAIADVASTHTNLIETIIEADEKLMESYLGGEAITNDKLTPAFAKALIAQSVIPIVFASAKHEVGVEELLDILANYCPSPVTGVKNKIILGSGENEKIVDITPEPSPGLVGLVLRIATDPKSHIKYTTIRILRGVMTGETSLQTASGKKGLRCGHITKLQGDHLDPLDEAPTGDIVTIAKLEELKVFDTVYTQGDPGRVKVPVLPIPMYSLAIEPKSRGDETKISSALTEITDADPTFSIRRDAQTNEVVVSGIGELHVRVVLARMHSRRGLEVTTKPPLIPYLETITGSVKMVEYTHKKQTGGAGQFGRVFIDMEPNERGKGYEFVDKIFGGVIDQSFRPSVDKGCQAVITQGVIAGFPVVDVKVSLVDGKTHPVDSKDIAFQIAGREAFKKAFVMCKPCLLEPLVNLEVTVPAENVGDITGDLAGRRGRVQGQDMLPGNIIVIKAVVPLAELQQYNSQLKSVTGGQGSYSMELSHYEPVPPNVQQQIVDRRKKEKQEEKE
jgi:elongation factor G